VHPVSPAPAASLHPLTPHHSSPALALSTMFRTLAVLSLAVFALATPKVATVISAADEKAYLTAHNTVRAQHNAAALVWNQTLSNAAVPALGRRTWSIRREPCCGHERDARAGGRLVDVGRECVDSYHD
jgi:hypothetical protein